MKMVFTFAILAFFLAACGSSGSSDSKSGGGGEHSTVDTSKCQGPAPAGATGMGVWETSFKTVDGMDRNFVMELSETSAHFQLSCRKGADVDALEFNVPAIVNDSSITILEKRAVESQNPSLQRYCEMGFERMTQMPYELHGSCLLIRSGNQVAYFIRVN
jgi:hypothetical protein